MKECTTSATSVTSDIDLDALVSEAWDAVGASFERFCVMAGISSLQKMMGEDAAQLAGQRCERNPDKPGYRWEKRPAWSAFTAAGSRWSARGCETRPRAARCRCRVGRRSATAFSSNSGQRR